MCIRTDSVTLFKVSIKDREQVTLFKTEKGSFYSSAEKGYRKGRSIRVCIKEGERVTPFMSEKESFYTSVYKVTLLKCVKMTERANLAIQACKKDS